jgi:hypothetical protein
MNPAERYLPLRLPVWATFLLGLAPFYFAAMYWASATCDPNAPAPSVEVLARPFGQLLDSKFGVVANDLYFAADADSPGDDRSTILLYEDGKLLGPAHSPQYHVAVLGMGRYVHWKNGDKSGLFVFSSSDNTDPNKNGRVYLAKRAAKGAP